MGKNPVLTVVVIVLVILAFTASAHAQTDDDIFDMEHDFDTTGGFMIHTITYDMEGIIDYKKQAGHFCNTGAEMKQVITGQGSMAKASDILMKEGYIDIDDENDWITSEDALENLIVTTTIRLCSPPKFVYGDEEVPVAIAAVRRAFLPVRFDGVNTPDFSDRLEAENWDSLTMQIWAVSVEANPGSSGQLNMDFDAAYGESPQRGEIRRIGDFFNISQAAVTNDGVVKRFIDISSPRSHAYVYENMVATGSADLRDTFRMRNLSRIYETRGIWYDLF